MIFRIFGGIVLGGLIGAMLVWAFRMEGRTALLIWSSIALSGGAGACFLRDNTMEKIGTFFAEIFGRWW
ncbi:MAG TPA: hypothetical protein VEB66_05220 [Opitutaceae bacterium]|nr:hypothetical protein [Opitutaceae bacterium]